MQEENENKCDYFNSFVKSAISDLNKNGYCYVYHKEHVEAIKKRVKKEIEVTNNDFVYVVKFKKH